MIRNEAPQSLLEFNGTPSLLVRAHSLTKSYADNLAVDHVTFDIQQGHCWGLLGPNGAGKTTLLRMLLGKTPPSAGQLEVLGYSIPNQAVSMRAEVGVVPQTDTLDPDFTVRENLVVYASYFGISRQVLNKRIPWLLEFASLTGREDAYINSLSGGMQRRLSIARALVNSPRLLVLDEPTTGLDPQARQVIWQRLRALRRDGLTLILTTHYMEEAERLCDQVTVMDRGRLLASDTPRGLIRQHVEAEVVEVHGEELTRWHHKVGSQLAERHELVGETGFYYARDPSQLLEAIAREPQLTFLHRRANLEDVFVRLTGRELRDE